MAGPLRWLDPLIPMVKALKSPILSSPRLSTPTKLLWIARKLRAKLVKALALAQPPYEDKGLAMLPPDGESISLEEALNSRCSSDSDGDRKLFHWGLFDVSRRLNYHDVQRIVSYMRVPRFTDKTLGIRIDQESLLFLMDDTASGVDGNWPMIEYGMHLQALLLTCAALGVGCTLVDLGTSEKPASECGPSVMRVRLGPMEPSYKNRYWTSLPPGREQAWKPGNLATPTRRGTVPFLTALRTCGSRSSSRKEASKEDLGQVLWAARGRTPHYYNSQPWGMTIPTSKGRQDNTTIYVMREREVYYYQNWEGKHPTHALVNKGTSAWRDTKWGSSDGIIWNCHVIIDLSEESTKNYWEAGYQLLNILLQAHVLGIGYSALLLDDSQRAYFRSRLGIPNATIQVSFLAKQGSNLHC